jgi:hypothetical protein
VQRGAEQLIRRFLSLAFALWPGFAHAESSLTVLSQVTLTHPAAWFGGLSGAEVSDDGRSIVIITDRNDLLTARIDRQAGKVTGLSMLTRQQILTAEGDRPRGPARDSEGLARGADGQLFISFEYDHRVARVNPRTGRQKRLRGHADFPGFPQNAGLEALAVDPQGRLVALPEHRGGASQPFPVYRLQRGGWRRVASLPGRGSFLPVGADFGPDGKLYLLERTVSLLGFRSRIRRFDLSAPDRKVETLLTSSPGRFDNLEALTIWQEDDGTLRLILLSDDNFLAFQRTELIELRLEE